MKTTRLLNSCFLRQFCGKHILSLSINRVRQVSFIAFCVYSMVTHAQSAEGAPDELQALSCDIHKAGESIRQQKLVVPKTLYHFGEKSVLLKNAKNNGIRQSDWNTYIMGDKGRFSLKPFRRGFYGGSTTNDIIYYYYAMPHADDDRNGGRSKLPRNWLTSFTLKDECRHPSKVASLFGLPEDQVFQNWFATTSNKQGFETIQEFAKECFIGAYFNDETVETTSSRSKLHRCEMIMEHYLVERDIKIVLDTANSRSFYIRDRSCIDSMSASPQDILNILSDERTKLLFTSKCSSYENPTYYSDGGAYFIYLIMSAVSDLRGNLPAQTIDKLLESTQIASDDSHHFKKIAPDFLLALKRCQTADKVDEFNLVLDAIIEKGFPRNIDPGLGSRFRTICNGVNGPTP